MSEQKINDPLVNEDSTMSGEHENNQVNKVFQNKKDYVRHQDRILTMIYPQFQNSYYQSIRPLNSTTKLKIQNWTQNRQNLNYLYFTQTESYIPFVNNQKIQLFQERHSELITNYLIYAMKKRQQNVQHDIIYGNLSFTNNNHNHKQKQQNLHQQSASSHHLTPQQLKAYEEQVRKRHKQIIKQQQQVRKRIEKLKLKQQKQKIQHQKKLQEQKRKQQQQMKKHHSQIISKKIAQNKQRREKQRKFFQQRNNDYKFILKSSLNNPALYEKMQINFRKRYESTFQQDRKKAKSQKSKFLQNSRVEELNIKDHEDKYLKWRSDSQAVRAAKMEEQNRLVEMYEKQLRKLKRYKVKNNQKDNSDQELSDNDDLNLQKQSKQYKSYHQLKQQIHKLAQQKRRKMQTYWQNFVKQQRQPQIDPKKQQELQNLIQSLQKSRKMKKVKNQKGEYVYEQLKPSDPGMKGLQYLEYSRQLGRKRKLLNPKNTHDQSSSIHQQSQKPTSKINYLKQLRQSRSSSLNTSKATKNKFAFLDKKDLSFHDKLQKVQRQTFKLQQMTKQSENQLKYGKFKTSQQILQYKEDIDNNHLEILKMKLMLAAANGN